MSVIGGATTAERGFGEVFGEAKGKLDNLQKNLAGALMPKFPGLPVGKFDDLSIGIDFHPTVVPPSPMMAVPHIGKVYDIMGAIMAAISSNIPSPPAGGGGLGAVASTALNLIKGMAPSVKVHNKWIAQAGIGILHLPGYVVHLLPTVASMSESEMFMGSSTVLADGAPCSTIMHPALSCNAVGFPPPFRKGKKSIRKLLMMPTALLTIITSAGKPVLVGGPPTIDLFQLGIKLGLKGLGKLKSSGKTKFLSHLAHKAIDKMKIDPKLAKILKNRACKMFGEPVDAATGRVFHTNVDFELPGPIPIVWERTYYSDAEVDGPLGYNWHHSYNMGIRELVDDIILFRHSDGRESFFPALALGETYYDRKEQLKWRRDHSGYQLEDQKGLLYRFEGGLNRHDYRMLSDISTKDGHRICFRYGSRGKLLEIIDIRNVKLSIDTDMEGRVTGVSTYLGMEETKLVRYRYDASGNMVETIDALNVSKHFCYNGHLLTKLTNQSGMSFYWEYEGQGDKARCVHTWGDGGVMEHFVKYEPGVTIETNGLGHTTEYYYHENKLIYKIVDANGGITHQLYNQYEELEVTVNPEGLSVKTEFDAYGNPLRITDENGNATSYEYDDRQNLVTMTTPGRKIFTWEYDEYDRVIKRSTPSGEKYTYTYEAGNLKTITDGQGREYGLSFNRNHELEELSYPKGLKRQWEYDVKGRLVKSTDVKGNVTGYGYDRADNLIRLEEADGNTHAFSYSQSGDLIKAKDSLHEVEFSYGPMGVVTERKQNNQAVRFTYDSELQLRSITNAGNEKYFFDLDGEGNVIKEAGFDGLTRDYIRDGAGRVKRIIRPNDKWTDYDYDGTGNVIRETQYDGRVTHYNYDADGLLKQAENARNDGEATAKNALTFTRDRAGRIIGEMQGEHQIKHVYDKEGNLVRTTSSLGADIAYGHDDEGNLLKMETSTWTAEWQRDNTGLELHRKMSGGVEIRTTRDSLGRETEKSIGVRNIEQSSKRYQWGVGNRLLMTEDGRTGRITRYNYDEFDNLIRADYENWGKQEIETIYRVPDRIGNLFETKNRTDRKYGKGSRLLEDPTYYYHYDDEGNLIFKEFRKPQEQGYHVWNRKLLKEKYDITAKGSMSGWLYEWDSGGMLTKVINPNHGKVHFGYDALGRRIYKEYKNKRTCWVWDGNVPLHEWTETKEEPLIDIITWVFENETFIPTARITDRGSQSIVTDYLGTPTQMFDENGNKTWEAELDIYGRVRTFAGSALNLCPFRYQGQYEDAETGGLYYNRFRYFDMETGNYISQDPISLHGGMHLYRYVNDTNCWIDPCGLITEGGFGVYADTKNKGIEIGNGVQRHHLNQTAIFGFNRDAGEVIGLKGNASVRGTQHYNAHLHMDDFYESMRVQGKLPSVLRYNAELYKSLRSAKMGVITSLKGTYKAITEQLRNGVMPWHKVPTVSVQRVAYH